MKLHDYLTFISFNYTYFLYLKFLKNCVKPSKGVWSRWHLESPAILKSSFYFFMVSVAKGSHKGDFIFKSLIKMSDIKIIKCTKTGKNLGPYITGLYKYSNLFSTVQSSTPITDYRLRFGSILGILLLSTLDLTANDSS